jgi:hypothetical protein
MLDLAVRGVHSIIASAFLESLSKNQPVACLSITAEEILAAPGIGRK